MAALILPTANKADVTDLVRDELPYDISVHYAKIVDDVIEVTLPGILA